MQMADRILTMTRARRMRRKERKTMMTGSTIKKRTLMALAALFAAWKEKSLITVALVACGAVFITERILLWVM